MPDDNRLGLETLLEVKAALGVDLDDELLKACFDIQEKYQFSHDRRFPLRRWTASLRTVSRRPEESRPRTGPDRMKLHTLTARNFMPFKGEMELTFPQDEHRNVMIVFGDNMRGKTSILNAVRWAFYGEALGRHSRPIPLQEIVNKDAALADDWRVEVHVKFDANGRTYDLRRVAQRRSLVLTPSKPDDFTRSIHLASDGSVISGDQVETEIGLIAPQQISRFFLFDGELLQEYETLLIEDNQQGRQIKEAIEQVLGVPALTNGRVDIQTILKQAQKRQNADLKQITGLEKQAERLAGLTARRDAIDGDLEDLNTRLKKVREERLALDDELEAAQSVIGAKATLDAKLEEQRVVIEECDKKGAERLDLISGAWKDLIDAQLQVRRDQLERQRKELMDSIKKRSAWHKRSLTCSSYWIHANVQPANRS